MMFPSEKIKHELEKLNLNNRTKDKNSDRITLIIFSGYYIQILLP
jgi:hypothetical protein